MYLHACICVKSTYIDIWINTCHLYIFIFRSSEIHTFSQICMYMCLKYSEADAVYIYICIYVYTCMWYMYICIYLHIYMYMYVCKYICMYIHMYIYVYTYIYVHIYLHVYIHIHTYLCIYIYIYIYIYISICIYAYTYTYTYITLLYDSIEKETLQRGHHDWTFVWYICACLYEFKMPQTVNIECHRQCMFVWI